MDDSIEMDDSSRDSEEFDAAIKEIDQLRGNILVRKIDAELDAIQPELKAAAKECAAVQAQFEELGILNVQDDTPAAVKKLEDLHSVLCGLSGSKEEIQEEEDCRKGLELTEQALCARRNEITLLQKRRRKTVEDHAGRLQSTAQRSEELQCTMMEEKAKAEVAMAALGIRVDFSVERSQHGAVRVDFTNLTANQNVDVGLNLTTGSGGVVTYVNHWPHNPQVDALGRELNESKTTRPTTFLISARKLLKDQCEQRTDKTLD
ncbi:hypothetical protein BV898_02878 [Hypsibius exemplaris]|uniref:Uncharacterized protein n=1 Tax=Hypsibius exemplaris TaxID=2072580 RepID=A0A1W0X6M4_HYPEX|nr:hypothetical protein BV898_02878 [Hypsibius exemplaris]